jgi:hypothetical protein
MLTAQHVTAYQQSQRQTVVYLCSYETTDRGLHSSAVLADVGVLLQCLSWLSVAASVFVAATHARQGKQLMLPRLCLSQPHMLAKESNSRPAFTIASTQVLVYGLHFE